MIVLSALVPDKFLTPDNFLNVFRRSSVNIVIAIGMTAIIISGGIDLSVGSMLALAGMAGAVTMLALDPIYISEPSRLEMEGTFLRHLHSWLMAVGGEHLVPYRFFIGSLVGVVTGTIAGYINGALINGLKLPPFILTLGTMSTFRGMAYVMNDGQPYNVSDYKFLGNGDVFTIPASFLTRHQDVPIPVSVVIAIVIIAVASVVLRYTTLGRYTYAIGANRTATHYSGVNVNRNLTIIYTLSGALVGLAAMIATSRTVSAQPTAGNGLELDIIAAVVIGGASLSGGRGTILGTIIGTLLISFLRNGCTLLGISTNVQLIVIGAIIVAAVSVDQLAREKVK
jgi:ribose/xylose/arabinose/galactoside ABC-type transport system permease subunit